MMRSARLSSSRVLTPGIIRSPTASSTWWTIRFARSIRSISPGVLSTAAIASSPGCVMIGIVINPAIGPEQAEHPGRHVLDRTVAVDLAQQTALPIIPDQGGGFFPVHPQALPDHVLLVVPPPAQQRPADQLVLRHVHQQHRVELLARVAEDARQRLRLGERPRIAVEQVPPSGVRLG